MGPSRSDDREANGASQDDLVARVSHELRTPLTPVRGYVQTLLRGGDRIDAATRTEILEQIVERVAHMERLIDDLLLVSRVAAGQASPAGHIDHVEVDVVALVRRLADWLTHGVASGRDVEVVAESAPLHAWADPIRVGQIVTNLISNACKYGYPGTPISIDLRRRGVCVEIAVSDFGPGIPESELEAVFERFHRVEDPSRAQTSGLGLGLFLARELAEALDGSLTVTSALGVGSTFVLSLPTPADVAIESAGQVMSSRALAASLLPD